MSQDGAKTNLMAGINLNKIHKRILKICSNHKLNTKIH